MAITLASIGSQGFADDTIRLARFLDVTALVAPLAALAVLRARRSGPRPIGVARSGRVAVTFLVVAAALAILLVVVGALMRTAEESTVTGAFVEGAWYVLVRPLWWSVGALALAAGLLVLGARAVAAPGGVRDAVAALWHWATRPLTGRAAAGRAIALIVGEACCSSILAAS